MYHFCNCFSWVLAFRQYLIASTISYWNPSVCPWAYQTRLYLQGFSRSTARWGLGRLPPLYHAEASSVTPRLPQLWSSCYHRAQSQSRPSNKPRAFSLEHIHIKWDCFSIKKKIKKKKDILKLNSHPCSPWRGLPTQQANHSKASPWAGLVCCLARKCFCLPLLKGHQCYSSLGRAAIILAESNQMSPFEYINCGKALGWEQKPRGKTST